MKAVKLVDVVKTFVGGVRAVDHVSLELDEGVLYGFVGPNGAGKSTLTNLISGYLIPDSGEIYVHGVRVLDYHQAVLSAGVVKVEQHPNLAPHLTPMEHLALLLPNTIPEADALRGEAESIMRRLGVMVELDRRVEELSIGHQRVFEITKALILCSLLHDSGMKPILILDEATAFLPIQQKLALKEYLRELVDKGYTIILISHDLSEVLDVSDEILVMSGGKIVAKLEARNLDVSELVKSMFEMVEVTEVKIAGRGVVGSKPILSMESVKVRDDRGVEIVDGLSLEVMEGEIHGVAVLPGTGEKELAEAIYGVRPLSGGRILFRGKDISGLSVSERKRIGIGFLSDDRVRDGLIPEATVEDNLTIGSEEFFTRNKLIIDPRLKERLAEKLVKEFSIVTKGVKAPVGTLSGGNMQRVYLGRVMGRRQPLLIALHPTVGLDPMGANLFFEKVAERKRQGLSTLIFSPNVKELMMTCDRISVMSGGRIVGTFRPEEVSVEKVGMMVSGVT